MIPNEHVQFIDIRDIPEGSLLVSCKKCGDPIFIKNLQEALYPEKKREETPQP